MQHGAAAHPEVEDAVCPCAVIQHAQGCLITRRHRQPGPGCGPGHPAVPKHAVHDPRTSAAGLCKLLGNACTRADDGAAACVGWWGQGGCGGSCGGPG